MAPPRSAERLTVRAARSAAGAPVGLVSDALGSAPARTQAHLSNLAGRGRCDELARGALRFAADPGVVGAVAPPTARSRGGDLS